MNKAVFWKIIAIVEIILAALVIVFDLFIPTIVILGMIVISLLIRREHISALGFKKFKNVPRAAITIFALVLCWQLLQLGLFMPIMNHLTGTTQDLSTFLKLQGNPGYLAFLLAASWTLAAFGEEMVYRGFLQKRLCDVFGSAWPGLVISLGVSSILFGIAHTEQGIIGVVITLLDALFFSSLKLKYQNNLWASILAHGFSNTVGIVVFYFTGPIYGLW
jgi:uncharacterized protein